MSQRVDERNPTRVELEAYNKILKLSEHVLSVAKPKEPKPNNKHTPKRYVSVANLMMECVIDMGADILEANEIYVGSNLDVEDLKQNYIDRIKLEEHAKLLSYRLEHIFRMLHYVVEYAESTSSYMMELLIESRNVLTKWIASEKRKLKAL